MSEVCDCGGKMKEHSADVRVGQKCRKIPNAYTLLDLLREMGAKEDTLNGLKQDLRFTHV